MKSNLYIDFNQLNNTVYSLKKFYDQYPHFNYHMYREARKDILHEVGEVDTIIYWIENDIDFDFTQNIHYKNKKNIIIYPHTPFCENNGGIMVQYNLAKLIDKKGERVRIYNVFDNNSPNSVFNHFYENDFQIDNNCIVIYCEGVIGNPLNSKHVVRWMLSELGKNVPKTYLNTWNPFELVYFFNNEKSIVEKKENQDKDKDVYKMLTYFYIHDKVVNSNNNERENNICYTERKKNCYDVLNMRVKSDSYEITRQHTFEDYIHIFNNYKYFVSYDPLTFLQVISVLCGCVCIVCPLKNVSKEDWYKMTAFYEYIKDKNIEDIYGISYGFENEHVKKAQETIHLLREQIDDANNWFIEKYIVSFLEDINNWENNNNLLCKVFDLDGYIIDFYKKYPDFNFNFYKKCYPDLFNVFGDDTLSYLKHYDRYGKNEGRMCCENNSYSC